MHGWHLKCRQKINNQNQGLLIESELLLNYYITL